MAEQTERGKRDPELCEALLDGWLGMSTAISNERLVSAMTYNESMVCGALYRQRCAGAQPLTATELCAELQILKPQMNVILNRLEQQGMIARARSRKDRRQVEILLTEQGVPVYEAAHREILEFPQALIDRLGAEKMRMFAQMMREVAAGFQELLEEREEKSKERKNVCGTKG